MTLTEIKPASPQYKRLTCLQMAVKTHALAIKVGATNEGRLLIAPLLALAILLITTPVMATHMLDNSADIQHIQEMLGHSNLSSTQVYTQVSNQALKDVHRQTHPASQVEDIDTDENDG